MLIAEEKLPKTVTACVRVFTAPVELIAVYLIFPTTIKLVLSSILLLFFPGKLTATIPIDAPIPVKCTSSLHFRGGM
jgi:hypothetical protein